ncbi:hypothetical protein M0208_07745 [Sphingomonas sp. SUN019]|uniref:ATP-grasp fold amidoligase family protein n=1 Tax=Sphingomonas sp. SUN019 TaxID=2937788 RepID=UPI0021643A14|nr:ATP-grasp fold amidoligase family protein [Sphingomonas sp. SUN019]UVO50415.1 hypothetical protein M0208_07745 [Sphingomonas sp. SUN019]
MNFFPQNDRPGDQSARLRVALTYLWRHNRLPNLANPTLFTELVQLRKLRDRDPRMPAMADKVAVKSVVAAQLGREWVIPMLWSGDLLPRHFPWECPVVVKSRHGCNQNVFVRHGPSDWSAARFSSARWMTRDYGWWLDEWLYAHIPRGLLIEPMIGNGSDLPIDYKIYVFGGQATHVQVHLGRERNHRWVMHDMNWRAIANNAPSVRRPTALLAMAAAAEHLAEGFSFARVDFYQPSDQPLFGEISFYPGSGLDVFDPPELDGEMGRLWLETTALAACQTAIGSKINAAARA